MVKFSNIPKFPMSNYNIRVGWRYLKNYLDNLKNQQHESGYSFNLNPDFQRGHIWTKQNKINYLRYSLQNGTMGRDIYFNHPGWFGNYEGDMVCLDGLQRVNTVLEFLDNKLKPFGLCYKQYTDKISDAQGYFTVHVLDLKTKIDILTFYLGFNIGGVSHSEKEIERVKGLLRFELGELTEQERVKYKTAFDVLEY